MLKEHFEEIKELRRHHTLQEIANKFGCTRERIRQLLVNENIKRETIKHLYLSKRKSDRITFYPKQCPICKKSYIVHQNWESRNKINPDWIYCPYPKDRKFCSPKCYINSDIFKNLKRNNLLKLKQRNENNKTINR